MFSPTPIIAAGSGVLGGYAAFRDSSPEDTLPEHIAQVGAGFVLGGMAGVGIYRGAKAIYSSGALSAAGHAANHSASGYYSSLSRNVARARIEASRMGPGKAAMRFAGRMPATMAMIGAGIGGAIGAKYDNVGTGVVAGAGVGLGLSGILKFAGSRIPGKGILATAAIAGGTFLAGRALQPEEFESQAEAVPDGAGYSYGEPGAVAARLNLMAASGDIALGLHNKRHG